MKMIFKKVTLTLCSFIVLLIFTSTTSAQSTLSGTVSDVLMTPISGVDVRLNDKDGNPIAIPPTFTDISGNYSISGLPDDDYILEFRAPVPYISPLVDVRVNGNTIQDVTLEVGKIISGFVRDYSNNPIIDIDINVYDVDTGTKLNTPGDNTDITGFYEIVVPVGFYELKWRAVGLNPPPYVTVDIPEITITNDTTLDINMGLGVAVSGTVSSASLVPVPNCALDFYDATTGYFYEVSGSVTDISGTYNVLLPTTIVDVILNSPAGSSYLTTQLFGVDISGAGTYDFTIDQGYTISGFVKDISLNPVSNCDIDIKDVVTGLKLPLPNDFTDITGFYQVVVPTGTYDLIYQPPAALVLAPIEFPNITINSNYINDVTVENGVLLNGIVQRSGSLIPVFNCDLDAENSTTGAKLPLTGDKTASDGTYTVVIGSGLHHVDFEPLITDFLVPQRLKNVNFVNDTSITILLDTGMVISGTVTDNLGAAVSNVSVFALNTSNGDTVFTTNNKTDISGLYSILVTPGTYHFHYHTDTLSGYIDSVEVNSHTVNANETINVQFGTGQPACCVGISGNIDNDIEDVIDISDLVYLVDFMFTNGPDPICTEEANVDGDIGNIIDISDLVYLVDFMFTNGPAPPNCL